VGETGRSIRRWVVFDIFRDRRRLVSHTDVSQNCPYLLLNVEEGGLFSVLVNGKKRAFFAALAALREIFFGKTGRSIRGWVVLDI
jgi:hypothetical protein